MNRTLLVTARLVTIFLLLGLCPAPGEKQPSGASHFRAAGLANTLLWKITGNNLAKPSFLFGTMHILCAGQATISDSLQAALAHCDQVYFEFKLDDLGNMLKSIGYMQMKNGTKLSDLLSSADYQKVKSYFDQHSAMVPFGMLERFKPMLISSLVEEEGLDCPTTDGMELAILKLSHEQHKSIGGLETAEFQAGLFDSIPYANQARDLVNYLDSLDYYKHMTAQLAEVYKQQDLTKIDELTRSGDASLGNYLDLLLYDRNRKWARELDSLMPRGSLLIAVGAGHLPGEKGLIQLLIDMGYTVSPIKN
jgi:uncharacterized protein